LKPQVVAPQIVNTPAPVVFNNSQTAANDSFATPIVRKLAKEQGVDLSQLKVRA
jgi:pyruvate/2-oxoglutarate dehydrogenase complex dihydrolipoamide acyltransferase (E2) component